MQFLQKIELLPIIANRSYDESSMYVCMGVFGQKVHMPFAQGGARVDGLI